VWFWLLWKYGKTNILKQMRRNPQTVGLQMLYRFPHTQAQSQEELAWATAACLVASVLSVSNSGLLLLVN
jgi:ABC-type phosphate transport system permease subunit